MLNAHQQQYVDQNADTWKHVKLHCRLYDVNAGKIVWSDRLDIARPAKAISVKGVVNRAADKIARTVSICKTTQG
jgi:TolB-like protein